MDHDHGTSRVLFIWHGFASVDYLFKNVFSIYIFIKTVNSHQPLWLTYFSMFYLREQSSVIRVACLVWILAACGPD